MGNRIKTSRLRRLRLILFDDDDNDVSRLAMAGKGSRKRCHGDDVESGRDSVFEEVARTYQDAKRGNRGATGNGGNGWNFGNLQDDSSTPDGKKNRLVLRNIYNLPHAYRVPHRILFDRKGTEILAQCIPTRRENGSFERLFVDRAEEGKGEWRSLRWEVIRGDRALTTTAPRPTSKPSWQRTSTILRFPKLFTPKSCLSRIGPPTSSACQTTATNPPSSSGRTSDKASVQAAPQDRHDLCLFERRPGRMWGRDAFPGVEGRGGEGRDWRSGRGGDGPCCSATSIGRLGRIVGPSTRVCPSSLRLRNEVSTLTRGDRRHAPAAVTSRTRRGTPSDRTLLLAKKASSTGSMYRHARNRNGGLALAAAVALRSSAVRLAGLCRPPTRHT